MRTNSQIFKDKIFAYILDCIDGENYGVTFTTDKEKLQFLRDTFVSEYGHMENIRYYGSISKTFANWLAGLPSCFNIEYRHGGILDLAREFSGEDPYQRNEDHQNRIIGNWFMLVTLRTFDLFKKHGIKL